MVKLRPITISDLKSYADLSAELFGSNTNLARLETSLQKIINSPDYILVVAEDETGQLVGAVMGICCIDTVGECRPFMLIENMIVSAKCRRRGIGKMLVDYLEAHARAANYYVIMLMSHIKRKEAHKFYEDLGYSRNIAHGYKKYL